MKQIRFKHLVTLGLCCSLLVNSITGITAIAETVTIESSPTVESSMKEETTKASTEESIKESTEKSTKESVEGSTVKSTAESMQESEESEQEEITKETTEERKQTEESSVVSPKQIQPIISNEDYYTAIQTELTNFVGRAQIYQDWSSTLPAGRMTFDITTPDAPSLNMTDFNLSADLKSLTRREYNSNLVDITSSKLSIAKTQNSLAIVVPEQTSSLPTTPARAYMNYLANIHLTVPKYVQSTSISGNVVSLVVNGRVGAANGPIENPRSQIVLSKLTTSSFEIHTDNDLLTNYYDTTNTSIGTVPGTFIWSVNRYGNANLENTVFMPKQASVITVALKKVTENFKDVNGTAIPAPTGFTQGKKTSITNNNYTFKQSGTLPETYKASNGKNYKFKGWYKGKTKPATLKTTKTPSYAVTYDNNDDLNVVYEVDTAKDYKFPSRTVNFQFVNEAGAILLPTPFTITTDLQQEINSTYTKLGSITGTNSGNTKQVTIPAKTIRADVSLGGVNNYGTTNTRITIPKFYENISLYTGNAYTQATLNEYLTVNNALGKPVNNPPLHYGLSKVTATQFKISEVTNGSNYRYSRLFAASNQYNLEKYYTPVGTIYYQLTNRKVTENFVDASGTKITPPTGFTQGNQIPMTSDTFKYTSAKALPASYSAGGKTYVFQGWYKGKTKPNTLTTSTTPTYNTTFDDNDDMTAVYKEASISANLTMRGAVDVIDNGGTMEYWEVLLKNTGEAPLTSIKIKPTTDWAAGISTPTELFILGTGQNTKVRPITKEQWKAGFEIPLDKSLPVGGQLTINLIGTKVTGQPNQVLKAAVEVSGNFNKLTASDTVRIKDLDQETKEPTGEGFISVPTFDFGQVGVASVTKQHGLKKAADYYGNGTRNPYVRISKTQPNWSLTAQLSQPKSATDSLPTATRLILGQVPIYSVGNYNLPTELMTSVGVTRSLGLTADNSSVSIIGNQEFSGADVYQLDFQFDKVKLEVPANQGVKGQQYQAAVTWNLVTGP
ncbi:WxL domain-containing protein [Enterococcus faecalis]|uniref:WxL domain-containing protein n=1 Tax=Enterococcus faecalis TaxID=1351 RepID=UPI000DE94049|nr:WxL domain-containing protein [Enterococcus faecalis]RBS21305.1 hypothetical protein EB04_01617 [Enterococcus faecalis]